MIDTKNGLDNIMGERPAPAKFKSPTIKVMGTEQQDNSEKFAGKIYIVRGQIRDLDFLSRVARDSRVNSNSDAEKSLKKFNCASARVKEEILSLAEQGADCSELWDRFQCVREPTDNDSWDELGHDLPPNAGVTEGDAVVSADASPPDHPNLQMVWSPGGLR